MADAGGFYFIVWFSCFVSYLFYIGTHERFNVLLRIINLLKWPLSFLYLMIRSLGTGSNGHTYLTHVERMLNSRPNLVSQSRHTYLTSFNRKMGHQCKRFTFSDKKESHGSVPFKRVI